MPLSMRWTMLPALSLLLGSCDDISRSDRPLSRVAAVGMVSSPLPPSARNIYYVFHAGGLQYMQYFLRFDVDKSELDAAVEALIADNNKTMETHLPYARNFLVKGWGPRPDSDIAPLKWWNPSSIRNGYYRGEDVSHGLEIWADEDLGRVYVSQSD